MTNRLFVGILAVCAGAIMITAAFGWTSMTSEQRLFVIAGLMMILGGILCTQRGLQVTTGISLILGGVTSLLYLMLTV